MTRREINRHLYSKATSVIARVKGEMQSSGFFLSHPPLHRLPFTFEQEIVFIVSVPHSRRGRSNVSLRKRMDGWRVWPWNVAICRKINCGRGLHGDSAPVLDVKARELAAERGGESSQLCRGRGGVPALRMPSSRGRSSAGMPAESRPTVRLRFIKHQ